MMTMMVISYISTWESMIYSYLSAKNEGEVWGEEME